MRAECVVFRDPPPVQAPSMHADAFVYCGKKAALTVRNVLPVNQLPEGTIIDVEEKAGDCGALARMSGNYATVIGRSPNDNKTRIRLPSGANKTDSRSARASVGIVAGGGHIGKPLLKAGHVYHKSKVNGFLDVSAVTSHSSGCSLSPSSPEGSFVPTAADMDIDIDYRPVPHVSSSIDTPEIFHTDITRGPCRVVPRGQH